MLSFVSLDLNRMRTRTTDEGMHEGNRWRTSYCECLECGATHCQKSFPAETWRDLERHPRGQISGHLLLGWRKEICWSSAKDSNSMRLPAGLQDCTWFQVPERPHSRSGSNGSCCSMCFATERCSRIGLGASSIAARSAHQSCMSASVSGSFAISTTRSGRHK